MLKAYSLAPSKVIDWSFSYMPFKEANILNDWAGPSPPPPEPPTPPYLYIHFRLLANLEI